MKVAFLPYSRTFNTEVPSILQQKGVEDHYQTIIQQINQIYLTNRTQYQKLSGILFLIGLLLFLIFCALIVALILEVAFVDNLVCIKLYPLFACIDVCLDCHFHFGSHYSILFCSIFPPHFHSPLHFF